MLEAQLDDLRKCAGPAELDEIRALLAASGHLRASHSRGKARHAAPSQPMRFVSADGYEILVGRNSAQNDRLTAAAPPDALWLHAKDMAGSHVVVPKGGDIPEATLRQAALLAAWFSRGYRSAQVPVDYTRRRFVKKPAARRPASSSTPISARCTSRPTSARCARCPRTERRERAASAADAPGPARLPGSAMCPTRWIRPIHTTLRP